MIRGVSAILVVLVIAAALFAGWYGSARKTYFDPALYEGSYPCSLEPEPRREYGPVDPEVEAWFAGPLRATEEPSLYPGRPPAGATTVRFTFLPSFSEPLIIRVDDLYGDAPRLTATRVRQQVRIEEGPDRLTRTLDRAEARELIEFLASSRVLDLPPDTCLTGVDGYIFLIEASGPGGYRFINRWGVREGPIYDLGVRMFRMTGWPNGPQGPDRSAFQPRSREQPNIQPSLQEP